MQADKVMEVDACDSYSYKDSSLDSVLVELARSESDVDHTLLLDSGEHCIWNFSLVRDVEDLRIVGNGSTTIRCAPGVGLAFYNTTRLTLANLVIDGCGMKLEYIDKLFNVVRTDLNFFFDGYYSNNSTYIAMALANSIDVKLTNCLVVDTQGLGLLGINLMGRSNISNVSFERNIPLGCFQHKGPAMLNFEKIGGGAVLVYQDYNSSDAITDVIVDIRNCSFYRNSYCGLSSVYNLNAEDSDDVVRYLGGGGGLTVSFSQLQYVVSLAIRNSSFQNNTGFFGGAAYFAYYTGVFNSSVVIEGCTFDSNGVDATVSADFSYPVIGSAVSVYTDFVQPTFSVFDLRVPSPSTVNIRDCDFVNNTAFTGVIAIFSLYNLVLPEKDRSELQVHLERCTFKNNKAVNGPVLYAIEYKGLPTQKGINVTLEDIEAVNNEVLSPSDALQSPMTSGVIHVNQINITFTGNTSLKQNSGTAVRGTSSTIYLQGTVLIHNNTAAYGGGMNLDGLLTVILTNNATVYFTNNSGAVAGGALFIEFVTSAIAYRYNDCFMYFNDGILCSLLGGEACSDVTKSGVRIVFEGNTAQLGGMIYGSTLETCPWAHNFRSKYTPGIQFTEKRLFQIFYDGEEMNFTSPFLFDRSPNDTADVATPALNLKVTDPGQTLAISNLDLAPGIRREVQLSARDAFGQFVPAVVTSRSSAEGTFSAIGSNYSFINYNSSLNTSLSVTSSAADPTNGTTQVTLFSLGSQSRFILNVSFIPCPAAYYFNSSSSNCLCLSNLSNYGITCTPEGGLVIPVNMWVGALEEMAQVVVVCPFDFCSRQVTTINSTSKVQQCNENYNRTGPGCGGCVDGYSLVFGSNRCLRCSNYSILLLLLFAFLGVLLMAVLLLLRISIAGGLLNGVLYFSNIVSLYLPLFVSDSSFVLFSWFSLKFGIESCFFDGMKPIHVAALNFVFPLYLYLLVFVIVMIARQSTKFSDFLFRTKASPAKLFATILVMTYSSLLESCIQTLSFTELYYITVNGTEASSRWRFDPTQRYFHGGHGALSMLAIILLVFFLIPAPILWMFPARIFGIKILRRYKPIYDAVWAPLKPRYLFWVSLRLLYRIPPLLFVSFFPAPSSLLLLAMFLTVTLFIQGTMQPFERSLQNVFDRFLQLLLLIITVLALYFTLLLPNGEADLEDLKVLNSRVNIIEKVQHTSIAFMIVIVYITCVIIFISHLLSSFPGLKRRLAILWNKVACKKIQVKVDRENFERERESTVIVHSEMPTSYDEDNDNNGKDEDSTTPVRATFSELREPLLDLSTEGSIRLYTVNSS